MQAICNSDSIDFAINFDVDHLTILRRQRQFAALNSHGIICNCIGCIDGFLIGIKCPSGVLNLRTTIRTITANMVSTFRLFAITLFGANLLV